MEGTLHCMFSGCQRAPHCVCSALCCLGNRRRNWSSHRLEHLDQPSVCTRLCQCCASFFPKAHQFRWIESRCGLLSKMQYFSIFVFDPISFRELTIIKNHLVRELTVVLNNDLTCSASNHDRLANAGGSSTVLVGSYRCGCSLRSSLRSCGLVGGGSRGCSQLARLDLRLCRLVGRRRCGRSQLVRLDFSLHRIVGDGRYGRSVCLLLWCWAWSAILNILYVLGVNGLKSVLSVLVLRQYIHHMMHPDTLYITAHI
mmetsp:Transcript_130432/g.230488  ORF Transcript_130432/g.230488 Transcript_130432/m.230488 type:complete len:256 (-) Transcript_130432:767-1534(-)